MQIGVVCIVIEVLRQVEQKIIYFLRSLSSLHLIFLLDWSDLNTHKIGFGGLLLIDDGVHFYLFLKSVFMEIFNFLAVIVDIGSGFLFDH